MAKSPIKLKVASPCSASWDDMQGDDAVRHCAACDKKVFQISNMSSEQVETFLLGRRRLGLKTCVRFYQRSDGTLLTSDCPVGVKRKRKKRMVSAFGALAVSASAVGLSMGSQSEGDTARTGSVDNVVVEEELIMGEEIYVEDVPPPLPPEEAHDIIMGGISAEPIEMLGDVDFVETPTESEED